MPGGDGTGPRGTGPNMGKGSGRRADVQARPSPRGTSGGFGRRRLCRGRGLKMGYRASGQSGLIGESTPREFRPPFGQPDVSGSELDYLKDYVSGLEESLISIRARIAEIQEGQRTTQTSE